MSSFEFGVPAKEIAGAEFILRVGQRLVSAVARSRITRAELARRLGVDKSTVSRMLRGDANLTLRTVGELCDAIGVEPTFSCKHREESQSANTRPSTWMVVRTDPEHTKRSYSVDLADQLPKDIFTTNQNEATHDRSYP